jgi:hypothetical protein
MMEAGTVEGLRSGTLNTVLFLAKASLFLEQTDAGYWPRRPRLHSGRRER